MKKMITLVFITVLAGAIFMACSGKEKDASGGSARSGKGIEIKGIVDLVPHSELINHVKDTITAEGVIVNLVATAADETTNERLEAGEIDFTFFQHFPYLSEWNEINGGHLVNIEK